MLGVSYEHICLAASWIMKTTGLLSGRVFPQLGWSTLMHEETKASRRGVREAMARVGCLFLTLRAARLKHAVQPVLDYTAAAT